MNMFSATSWNSVLKREREGRSLQLLTVDRALDLELGDWLGVLAAVCLSLRGLGPVLLLLIREAEDITETWCCCEIQLIK